MEWPLRLPAAQVRGLLEHQGLRLGPGSPLAALGEGDGAPLDASLVEDPQVRRALAMLAAPLQFLVLGGPGVDGPPGLLVGDGEAVVRFDIGSEGCMLSAPHVAEQFAALVCDLADAPEEAGGEVFYAGRRYLDILEAVVALENPSVADARAAIASAGSAELVDVALESLVEDGTATIEGDRLRLDAGWLAAHDFLTADTSLRVVAHDCVDMAAGISRPTALTIVDSEPRRMVMLPPSLADAEPETILAFEPLTRGAVVAGVAALLEPPGGPPVQPASPFDGDARAWLSAAPASALPEWRTGFWERIVALEPDLPDALASPGATLQFLEQGTGTVIALTRSEAVEWKLVGSCVHWRSLSEAQVAARLRELLPGGPETPATGCAIGEPALLALMTGAGAGADLPEPLRPLAGGARWTAIRALVLTDTVLHGTELILATAPDGTVWRFEPEDGRRRAIPASATSLLDEIREGLAPSAA
jgi:hypothetical protein